MNGYTSTVIGRGLDYDGDGEQDYFVESATSGAPYQGQVYLSTAASGGSVKPLRDLVASITDGLGKTTAIQYKAAKDSSIYTKDVHVAYPIRETFSSEPVVSDVLEDTGSSGTPYHFSYQYSGNRLDLSGRGSLGFHSFVTLDDQTLLFKYQFLAQSFPMTGLVQRDETYRTWTSSGTADFRLIDSHDNTVVFDEVLDPSTSTYSTLFPFISQAVESRWEDSSVAHFSFTQSGVSSMPVALFPAAKPAGSYLTITAQSWFDNQPTGSPVTTLPTQLTNDQFQPGDENPTSGANSVGGTLNFGDFNNLPRYITYGNLMQLTTTYDPNYSVTKKYTYVSPWRDFHPHRPCSYVKRRRSEQRYVGYGSDAYLHLF